MCTSYVCSDGLPARNGPWLAVPTTDKLLIHNDPARDNIYSSGIFGLFLLLFLSRIVSVVFGKIIYRSYSGETRETRALHTSLTLPCCLQLHLVVITWTPTDVHLSRLWLPERFSSGGAWPTIWWILNKAPIRRPRNEQESKIAFDSSSSQLMADYLAYTITELITNKLRLDPSGQFSR